jgi:potassium channel subfamily K
MKYVRKIIYAVALILIAIFGGAVFFTLNEGWYFAEGFYFCVVTTTTVGYGDLDIKKDSSRSVPFRQNLTSKES